MVDDKPHPAAIRDKRGESISKYADSCRTEVSQLKVKLLAVLQTVVEELLWRVILSRSIGSVFCPIYLVQHKRLNKAVRTHNIITKDIHQRSTLVLLAVLFLATDDVEFYLADALWLDEVCKTLILIPRIAVFLEFHRLCIEIRMLLVEPYPFYLLLEETEVAAGATAAIGARLAIHFERDFFIVGRYSNTAFPQQTEDVVLHKYISNPLAELNS